MKDGTVSLEDKRLGRLERAVRRQRILITGILAVAALSVLLGATNPNKEVTAQRFVVKDGQGHVRAALSMGPAGGPSLSLYDQAGRMQADLSVILDHPQLNLYRKNGNAAAEIAIGTDDNAGIWLLDHSKRERLVLQLRGDEEDAPVLKLGVEGGANLVAAVIRTQPALVMLNASGSSIWQAP